MISIVIPCFNHVNLLPKSVGSVLKQTYKGEYEIIVVDDGSDILVRNIWGDKVRIIRHEQNRGLSAALNTGISASKGEKFVILAADDELAPLFLEQTDKYDYADIVSVDMLAGGERVEAHPGSLEALKKHNCHSYAALVKRRMFDATGGFKETMNPSWEDYEFWLNCAKHGAKWRHVSQALHIYNRNPAGRDAQSQGKDFLLRGKMEGYHQDVFGKGRGVVTFVIPCYKHEQYLRFAVNSALGQVYPHTTVVVVNDGSPNFGDSGNQNFLASIPSDRLKVVNKENGGLSSARNAGIDFAINEWDPQYLVMLDADDEVDRMFLENTMAAVNGKKDFIYTDIKFIGDASHELDMENFDCRVLVNKHLHPCTFLAHSGMFKAIKERRGKYYDESIVMRTGYEDWDFSIAAMEVGFCGRRLPGHWFRYRFHEDGSMRTQAKPYSEELLRYIRSRHEWMLTEEGISKVCAQCCGGVTTYVRRTGKMHINKLGEVGLDEPLIVTYTGSTTSTITKIGASQRIYKYSGNPANTFGPTFTIMGCDAKLFEGPYIIRRATEFVRDERPDIVNTVFQPEAPKPEPPKVVPPPEPVVVRRTADAGPVSIDNMTNAQLEQRLAVSEGPIQDDFEVLGLSAEQSRKLAEAGFALYDDLADASETELIVLLGLPNAKVKKLKKIAGKIVAELAKEE